MSSQVFRQIASGERPARAERLFKAAITAFCALVRPSRAEAAQLDDLTSSLLPHVSAPCRRFAAAALSDCLLPPAGLVRRLCDESVEIAAPLLARSPVLGDAELIRIISRHGMPHARVIAQRPHLGATVSDLIQAMFRSENAAGPAGCETSDEPEPAPSGEAAENARRRLRGMMRGGADPALPARTVRRPGYTHLRDTALLDHRPFFHTTLADALGVELVQARNAAADPDALLSALSSLGLRVEEAFLIHAAVSPKAFGGPAGIRAFLERFAELEAAKPAAPAPRGGNPAAPHSPVETGPEAFEGTLRRA